jgi:hypothetical protein
MKKLSFYTFIATASLILPMFTSPSWAKKCPTIPENIQQVTVKSDSAFLRKEPKQESEKGFKIRENDPLKVLDPKPAPDKEKQNYCWYQVRPVKDTSQNKYWIADVGIKEFEKFSSNPSSPKNSSTSTSSTPDNSQNIQKETSIPLQLHLVLILSGLGIIINALILLLFYREVEKILNYLNLPSFLKTQRERTKRRQSIDDNDFREQIQGIIYEQLNQFNLPDIKIKLDKVFKDLGLERKKTNPLTANPNASISTDKTNENEINNQKQTTKETLSQIVKKLQTIIDEQKKLNAFNDYNDSKMAEFSKLIQELQQQILRNQEVVVKPDNFNQEFQDTDSNSSLSTSSELSQELTKLVTQFNHQNREPFNDARFQPLKLTQQSTQGHVGLNAHRILELEVCTDNSQASYLQFEMDGENWLIPNITSSYISQIMRNLDENRDIFVTHTGSGTLQLVKPAKLKNIGLNLWGIEEPGEFTQQ